MQSAAPTVAAYLASLPADRRQMVETLRNVILQNIDPAYEELMQYGMMGWAVPFSMHPAGYHCDPTKPLSFAAIASQKNYVSLYLIGLYIGGDGHGETAEAAWFRASWAASGKKKLDMGKSCVRIKKIEDVPLDVIGEAFRRMPAKQYLAAYLSNLKQ